MGKRGKRYLEAANKIDRNRLYSPEEAITALKEVATAKFDETVEISIKLGVDPRRSDQTVRGTVILPYGTGKTPRVIAFAKGDKSKEAEDAGADEVGADELIQKVKGGWMNFDIAVATPDMMGMVGSQLGRILGPRMPNPKAGTVSMDIGKTIRELKSGKVQFRIDKHGIIHLPIGKVSFKDSEILKNLGTLIEAVIKSKPAASKGQYLRSVVISPSMGPGIKIDAQKVSSLTVEK